MNQEQTQALDRKLEEDKAFAKHRIAELMSEEHYDEDGYPTEEIEE